MHGLPTPLVMTTSGLRMAMERPWVRGYMKAQRALISTRPALEGANFPVFFADIREMMPETGSRSTATPAAHCRHFCPSPVSWKMSDYSAP